MLDGLLKMEMDDEHSVLEVYEVESGKLFISVYNKEKNDAGYSIEVSTKDFLYLIGEVTKPMPNL